MGSEDDIFTWNGRTSLDCHIQDGAAANHGRWKWHATEAQNPAVHGTMVIDLTNPLTAVPDANGFHNLTVYLPVWVPVVSLFVGIPAAAASRAAATTAGPSSPRPSPQPPLAAAQRAIDVAARGGGSSGGAPAPPPVLRALALHAADAKPIYVWGSSIAQGGVVSNAGMTWPMNLQRLAQKPLLNFGFSGSCGMQPTVAAQLAKARPPPSIFLMDCQPNMQGQTVPEMHDATREILVALRVALGAATPIVVLEGHLYTNNWIKAPQREQQLALSAAQKEEVVAAQSAGDSRLFYIGAEGKLGDDPGVAQESAGGVGVHPVGLAHLHMAEFVTRELKKLKLL